MIPRSYVSGDFFYFKLKEILIEFVYNQNKKGYFYQNLIFC